MGFRNLDGGEVGAGGDGLDRGVLNGGVGGVGGGAGWLAGELGTRAQVCTCE